MDISRPLAALLAAVPLWLGSGAAVARDQLTIGITQYPATLHPNIEAMLAKTYVLSMAHRPFTAYDQRWELVCMLCETLPTFENGLAVKTVVPHPDKPGETRAGVDLTYTIRAGAAWGDGTPVSTRDVLFTWEVGRHPQAGVAGLEFYRQLPKVSVHDDRRFTLHFAKLTYAYNAINDFRLMPAHLERPVYAHGAAEYRHRTLYLTAPTTPGLWFGPYRVARATPGAEILLEPNPTWWGDKPAFKRILVKAIENTAALEATILAGGVDMIAGELGLKIDQALGFEKRHAARFVVTFKPGLVYEHIDLMLDNPALADKRVRRALLHALDRQALTQQLFEGRQAPAKTFVNPLDWVHDGALPPHAFDPARAKALLAEAGWTPGADGIRRNAEGKTLRLELMTTAGDRNRELVQQALQSMWRQVGIDVPLRNQPPRVFFGETVSRRKFDAMAMFAWVSAPESVPRSSLHSGHIPSPANNWGGQNYTGFRNAAADDLIERIEVELDRPARQALWHRLQAVYAEELPSLPLYFRAETHVWPKWLKGVEPTGHQDISPLWVERWRAEP